MSSDNVGVIVQAWSKEKHFYFHEYCECLTAMHLQKARTLQFECKWSWFQRFLFIACYLNVFQKKRNLQTWFMTDLTTLTKVSAI